MFYFEQIDVKTLRKALDDIEDDKVLNEYQEGIVRSYIKALDDLDTSLVNANYDFCEELDKEKLNLRQRIETEIREEYATLIYRYMLSNFWELINYLEDMTGKELEKYFKEE